MNKEQTKNELLKQISLFNGDSKTQSKKAEEQIRTILIPLLRPIIAYSRQYGTKEHVWGEPIEIISCDEKEITFEQLIGDETEHCTLSLDRLFNFDVKEEKRLRRIRDINDLKAAIKFEQKQIEEKQKWLKEVAPIELSKLIEDYKRDYPNSQLDVNLL